MQLILRKNFHLCSLKCDKQQIMRKVLGMGNALVDVLMKLDSDQVLSELALPKGSMQLVDSATARRVFDVAGKNGSSKASGGSAANTIHALANLGVNTGFFGKVGRDEWGAFFRNDMQRKNISPLLLLSENESGRAMALISPDSERTFATCLGAAVELSANDLPDDLFHGYTYFHVEGYLVQNQELIREALKKAKARGLKVSLDLASYNVVTDNLDFLRSVVTDYVDILFANEEEARAFTQGLEGHEALEWMGNLCETAVLKLGEKGSMIKHIDTVVKVGILPASPVDTTGAGDLYAAGFLYGLIHAMPLEHCGYIGAMLSANVIEVIGPKMDEARWESIRAEIQRLNN